VAESWHESRGSGSMGRTVVVGDEVLTTEEEGGLARRSEGFA
jgi:hypothetical protein